MLKLIGKMKNKKGFTLIELIIVIAVLGIILAIAVPRFGAVQNKAKVDADKATAGMVAKAAELYIVAEKVIYTTSTTVAIETLVDKNYIENPKWQSETPTSVTITVDDKGKASVTAGAITYP